MRFEIPADISLVGPLRQRFMDAITYGDISEGELYKWELVFQEMLVNAICHGAKQDKEKSVTVEWSITQDSIVLAACDPGAGPPDSRLEKPELPDPESLSGRGLFIIASFADRLNYWRGPSGFRLELIKFYPAQGLPLAGNPELDSVLEELSSSYESLSVFHRLAQNLIESGDLRDFISGSLDEYLTLHPTDRLFMQGSATIPENIRSVLNPAPWFLDPNDADRTMKVIGSLPRETVWENGDDLLRQYPSDEKMSSVGPGCMFPIVAGDTHFGALIVMHRKASAYSRTRSLGILRTLSDLCGIACANAHLSLVRDASQRELREFEIAVEIQRALLPILPVPVSKQWKVSICQESALTIAGDYAIARTDASGNLVLAMIDVMGKGVSAALLASIFRTAFEMSLNISSAASILETINSTLCSQLGELTMFITCAVARLSKDGRSFEHASAGHCPTFIYDADGKRTFLKPSGPPLGVVEASQYRSDKLTFHGGERIVFVTDGCYEWGRNDQHSGWEPFVDFIDSNRLTAPEVMWNQLRENIREKNEHSLEDDCTLITLDILS
ncbi:MAG: SpoIIE family protein phosphatase [Luteolibacter sp.]